MSENQGGATQEANSNAQAIESTESSQEVQQEGQSAINKSGEEKAGKTPAKTQQQMLKELAAQDLDALVVVKVNGKEQKLPVKEVLKMAQNSQASTQKFQQASEMLKKADSAFRMAMENPEEFLRRTGKDPEEFAEAVLAKKYELLKMTPEQRKLKEYEAKEEQWKKEQEELKNREQMTAREREEARELQNLDQEIGTAWKESGLPADKFFITQIASQLLASERRVSAGVDEKHLSAKEAADKVKSHWLNSTRKIADQLPVEQLIELFGEQNIKKIREHDLKRVTGNDPASRKPDGPPASGASRKQQPEKVLNEHEWRKRMQELSRNF